MFTKHSLAKTLSVFVFVFTAFSASSEMLSYSATLQADDDNSPLIDFYSFTVLSDSEVTINVFGAGLSVNTLNTPNPLDNMNALGIDIGNGESTLDTFLVLASDDGDRSADDIIDADDDGGESTDSFLEITLSAGNYMVGVSSCCVSDEEFVAGSNFSIDFSSNLVGSIPDYVLQIEGDVSAGPTQSVSTPSVVALLSLCVFGLFARARK